MCLNLIVERFFISGCVACGLAVFFEKKSNWESLSMYIFPRVIEALPIALRKRKSFPAEVKFGNVKFSLFLIF